MAHEGGQRGAVLRKGQAPISFQLAVAQQAPLSFQLAADEFGSTWTLGCGAAAARMYCRPE
jgi:hypothetical protein